MKRHADGLPHNYQISSRAQALPLQAAAGARQSWEGQMSICLRRREFIAALGGAAVAWPLAAGAQQPGMPVIGYLSSGPPQPNGPDVSAFRAGLAEAGYFEGKNLAIEYRWGVATRVRALAAELVNLRVAVLVAVAVGADASAFAARDATSTIPI